jgi:hypothetical protein
LNWFIALVCGSRRTQRNTHLKVAGFDRPLTVLYQEAYGVVIDALLDLNNLLEF